MTHHQKRNANANRRVPFLGSYAILSFYGRKLNQQAEATKKDRGKTLDFLFSKQTLKQPTRHAKNEARKERRREVTAIFYGRQPTAQEKLAITQVARMFVVVSGGVEHPRAGLHTVSNWPGKTEASMVHSSILRSSTTEETKKHCTTHVAHNHSKTEHTNTHTSVQQPVPGTSVSSVRRSHNTRGTGTQFLYLPGTSVSSVRPCHNTRNLCEFCKGFILVPGTYVRSVRPSYPYPEVL